MNKNNRKEKKDNLNILKFIGPGLLVTVGFIDPGNWASNIAAGSGYGYTLLWMVTLSTIMLIILQHNAAHLGIVTGLCLSEAASRYINRVLKNVILGDCGSRCHCDCDGRDFRRCHCTADAVPHSD